jgi:ribosome-associated protein
VVIGAWRSLVAHLLWEQGVAGSNPAAPIFSAPACDDRHSRGVNPEPSPPRLQVNEDLWIPLAEITQRTSRSSGPGGQHANVTASRVEASFDVLASTSLSDSQRTRLLARLGAQVTAVAQDSRSQLRNRELALERLGERISAALARPKRRRATRPSAASRERRLQAKRHASERKRGRRPPESM